MKSRFLKQIALLTVGVCVLMPGLNAIGESNNRMKLKLIESVPVKFDNVPLERVIQYFENVVGIHIEVDWNDLEDLNVTPDTPVTLQIPNIPGNTALKLSIYAAIAGADKDVLPLSDYSFLYKFEDKLKVAVSIDSEAKN